jgi:hypothetical protein
LPGISFEPDDPSGIPFRIDLDDLYQGSQYMIHITDVQDPGGVVFSSVMPVPKIQMVDESILLTGKSYLPDNGLGGCRTGKLKSAEIRYCL